MRKEFEINGCIEVSPEVTEDKFWEKFINFVESRNPRWLLSLAGRKPWFLRTGRLK